MVKAKCHRCGRHAIADTYDAARKQINHATGLSSGKKCGDSYGRVMEIKPIESKPTPKPSKPVTKTETPKGPGRPKNKTQTSENKTEIKEIKTETSF